MVPVLLKLPKPPPGSKTGVTVVVVLLEYAVESVVNEAGRALLDSIAPLPVVPKAEDKVSELPD